MYKNRFVTAIVAAAGMGKRMQRNIGKQFLTVGDKPILAHSLKKIEECRYVDYIVIVIKKSDINYIGKILNSYNLKKPFKLVYGGKERQDSIYAGLQEMPQRTEIVLTHDGVRPFVREKNIEKVIEAVDVTGASVLAIPVIDTIKVSLGGQFADYTPDRSKLYAVQTPQVFLKDVLLKAYKQAYQEEYYGTDDCSLVEKTGIKISLVKSDNFNIKITTPEDLTIAEAIIKSQEVEDENRDGI